MKDLSAQGYHRLGQFFWGLPLHFYFHPDLFFSLTLIPLDSIYLLFGSKDYSVVGQTPEGRQSFVQDVPAFNSYLSSHFPECHVYLDYYRDIIPKIVPHFEEILKRKAEFENGKEELREIKEVLDISSKRLQRLERLKSFQFSVQAIQKRKTTDETKAKQLTDRLQELQQKLTNDVAWIKAYEENGNASALFFRYATVPYIAHENNFADVLNAVQKDIIDTDRHEIRQKLQGGKLQIFIKEVQHPNVFQLGMYGTLAPRNWQRIASKLPHDELSELADQIYSYLIPTLENDTSVKGHIEKAHRLPAMALRDFLKKSRIVEKPSIEEEYPIEGGWLGHVFQNDKLTDTPLLFKIKKMGHTYGSGKSGAGKSFTARILVENALLEGIKVIILDPTRQWCGLAKRSKSEAVFKRYENLGISRDHARSFNVKIYTPEHSCGLEVPRNMEDLLEGCSVITFKHTSEETRFEVSKKILQAVYDSMDEESEEMHTLIVLEEAHKFLRASKEVHQDAKIVAKLIDDLARESRKYGIYLLILTQSLSDLRHSEKTVRENINTRFFMRASDRAEHEYIESYVSRNAVETVKNLKNGEALLHSPDLVPTSKIFVRPPFSHVGELTDKEIRELQFKEIPSQNQNIEEIEIKALQIIHDFLTENARPIIQSELMEKLNITSARKKKQLIDRLEFKGLIKAKTLTRMRGKPKEIRVSDEGLEHL